MKNQLPELPSQTYAEIKPLLKQSGELERAGKINEAIGLLLEAYAKLPEPKSGWNFVPQMITSSMVRQYGLAGNSEKVHEWKKIAHLACFSEDQTDQGINCSNPDLI